MLMKLCSGTQGRPDKGPSGGSKGRDGGRAGVLGRTLRVHADVAGAAAGAHQGVAIQRTSAHNRCDRRKGLSLCQQWVRQLSGGRLHVERSL